MSILSIHPVIAVFRRISGSWHLLDATSSAARTRLDHGKHLGWTAAVVNDIRCFRRGSTEERSPCGRITLSALPLAVPERSDKTKG
jgi:hypothetical protein